MPRDARIVIAGCAHHVVQRGNNRQDVFFVDADRTVYLELLRDAAERFHLKVDGYCLMTNHLHLVVTPEEETSLAETFKRTNLLYTQYVNRMHARSGHLWQERYYSCTLDLAYFWRALAYVERNPVRAHLCGQAYEWRWSSAGAHCGGDDSSGLLDLASWKQDMDAAQWRQQLERTDDDEQWTKSFHLCTSRGRPLGSDAAIAKLETLLGRRLRPLPRGHPRRRTVTGSINSK
jgi:putative transposase